MRLWAPSAEPLVEAPLHKRAVVGLCLFAFARRVVDWSAEFAASLLISVWELLGHHRQELAQGKLVLELDKQAWEQGTKVWERRMQPGVGVSLSEPFVAWP